MKLAQYLKTHQVYVPSETAGYAADRDVKDNLFDFALKHTFTAESFYDNFWDSLSARAASDPDYGQSDVQNAYIQSDLAKLGDILDWERVTTVGELMNAYELADID